MGARESLNRRKNIAQRKVKNYEKSLWGQCLTRPVPNGCCRSAFWLGGKTQKFSGTNQKAEWRQSKLTWNEIGPVISNTTITCMAWLTLINLWRGQCSGGCWRWCTIFWMVYYWLFQFFITSMSFRQTFALSYSDTCFQICWCWGDFCEAKFS